MVVAIDGPAGTGKSTVAKKVSEDLGLVFLNSGSFYRALTLALLDAGVDIDGTGPCTALLFKKFCGILWRLYKWRLLTFNGV